MGKARKKSPAAEIEQPTAEQRRRAQFDIGDVTDKPKGGASITIGKAYRRRRMLDVLIGQEMFSDAEGKALRHYQHHADVADRSVLRDSLNMQRGGSGIGPTVEILNAVRVRDDCERAAGSLRDILRAVVVDDRSLSDWAMDKHGAVEKHRQRKGRVEAVLEPVAKGLVIAKMEISMAAKRVQAELDA